MYKAYVQMPVLLYDDVTDIVEAELELADSYRPTKGSWIYNEALFRGILPIGPIVYDCTRNAVVLTSMGTSFDRTVTLEEWLQEHPGWVKAEKPFVSLYKKRPRHKQVEEDDEEERDC